MLKALPEITEVKITEANKKSNQTYKSINDQKRSQNQTFRNFNNEKRKWFQKQ